MPQLPLVHRGITSRKLKTMVYVLEGLNSLATTYFYYYLYFYTQSRFNFQALQNLWLASFLGFVYAGGSFFGGRLAQRFGYFTSIRLGVLVMAVAFVSCGQAPSLWLAVAFTLTGSLGMCCTWPAMEALVSEGEPPARLQGLVGIYNFVWAVSAAFAGTISFIPVFRCAESTPGFSLAISFHFDPVPSTALAIFMKLSPGFTV